MSDSTNIHYEDDGTYVRTYTCDAYTEVYKVFPDSTESNVMLWREEVSEYHTLNVRKDLDSGHVSQSLTTCMDGDCYTVPVEQKRGWLW